MTDIHHPNRFFYIAPPTSPSFPRMCYGCVPIIRCCSFNQSGCNLVNGAYEINEIDFYHIVMVVGPFFVVLALSVFVFSQSRYVQYWCSIWNEKKRDEKYVSVRYFTLYYTTKRYALWILFTINELIPLAFDDYNDDDGDGDGKGKSITKYRINNHRFGIWIKLTENVFLSFCARSK